PARSALSRSASARWLAPTRKAPAFAQTTSAPRLAAIRSLQPQGAKSFAPARCSPARRKRARQDRNKAAQQNFATSRCYVRSSLSVRRKRRTEQSAAKRAANLQKVILAAAPAGK